MAQKHFCEIATRYGIHTTPLPPFLTPYHTDILLLPPSFPLSLLLSTLQTRLETLTQGLHVGYGGKFRQIRVLAKTVEYRTVEFNVIG